MMDTIDVQRAIRTLRVSQPGILCSQVSTVRLAGRNILDIYKNNGRKGKSVGCAVSHTGRVAVDRNQVMFNLRKDVQAKTWRGYHHR